MWSWLQQNDASLSVAAVAIALLALVRSWRVQRNEWILEANRLAAEASALARSCMGLHYDIAPTVDAVFSFGGMTDSSLHKATKVELKRRMEFAEETRVFADWNLKLDRWWLPIWNLPRMIRQLTKAVHDVRLNETSLRDMQAMYRSELFDARQRMLPAGRG